MSYTAGETLILTRLRAISGTVWTSANTAQGKWGILDSGASNHYCIIKQGPFTNDPLSLSYTMRHWTTVIELWVSYTDDGTSYTNLLAYQEAILDAFDNYRKLGDTTGSVSDSRIARGDEVEEMWTKSGGVRWLRQKFYVDWSEENFANYAE